MSFRLTFTLITLAIIRLFPWLSLQALPGSPSLILHLWCLVKTKRVLRTAGLKVYLRKVNCRSDNHVS